MEKGKIIQQTLRLKVEEGEKDCRLDIYLADKTDFSRSYIQKLIKGGQVTVNGNLINKVKVPVSFRDEIVIIIPEIKELEIVPEKMDLDILYEDNDVLVVNKPKDMVVHPSAGHTHHTLVNGLLYHCKNNLSGINGVLRPGIVHRIDKDTTGALIVCKNDKAHQSLAEQLQVHSITRKYNAIVYNNFTENTGTVCAAIGRHPIDRKRMAVVQEEKGKRAITHYQVLDHLNHDFNHIECQLETGRTHQIRVHMSYIHHPLLGDEIYGPKSISKNNKNLYVKYLKGQALHARIIGFQHPTKNQYIEIEAPMPQYFVELLKRLK